MRIITLACRVIIDFAVNKRFPSNFPRDRFKTAKLQAVYAWAPRTI